MYSEIQSAKHIVEKLGKLPLALAQAAAYIVSKDCDFRRYLQRLENIRNALSTQSCEFYRNGKANCIDFRTSF